MPYILDLPKYLIDNLLDYVSYLSMLSSLPRFKINIYAYWISISIHCPITKYKTQFAKYNAIYIHSIISTSHANYCY